MSKIRTRFSKNSAFANKLARLIKEDLNLPAKFEILSINIQTVNEETLTYDISLIEVKK